MTIVIDYNVIIRDKMQIKINSKIKYDVGVNSVLSFYSNCMVIVLFIYLFIYLNLNGCIRLFLPV